MARKQFFTIDPDDDESITAAFLAIRKLIDAEGGEEDDAGPEPADGVS